MAVIRTVLGDVDSGRAGVTLAHEHILYAYPGADLDHRTQFDFEEVADRIAGVLRSGLDDNSVATIVEMTPVEVYRHPPLFRAVAERSGIDTRRQHQLKAEAASQLHQKGILERDYGPLLRTLNQARKDIWYEGDDPELGGDLDDLVR